MSSQPYKLLLLDLDGTLLRADGAISYRVSAAVLKASAALSVSIATGREKADVVKYARQLGLTAPQVSDNGALIVDPATGEPLWSTPLGTAPALAISRHLGDLGVATIATHPGGTAAPGEDISRYDINRISALDLGEEMADVLVSRFLSSPDVHVVKVFLPYNGLWAVDFTRSGISKAAALRWLAARAGVPPAAVIAAGDSYNDLDMLLASGLRIVMGDAPEELKAVADYLAPTAEEDGLAVAIGEFVMPRVAGPV